MVGRGLDPATFIVGDGAHIVPFLLPPSDEGGGFCIAKDGGRDKLTITLDCDILNL